MGACVSEEWKSVFRNLSSRFFWEYNLSLVLILLTYSLCVSRPQNCGKSWFACVGVYILLSFLFYFMRREGVDATLLSYTLRYINLANFNGHNLSGWVTDAPVCMRERGAETGGGGHTFF